jgi:hypothetical protein
MTINIFLYMVHAFKFDFRGNENLDWLLLLVHALESSVEVCYFRPM